MSTHPGIDWNRILEGLGDDRRLLIQSGVIPGTAEIRVEERDPAGFRASRVVSKSEIANANFDLVEYTVGRLIGEILDAACKSMGQA